MKSKMQEGIKKVFEELSELDPEEFRKEFEAHIEGDIANILLETEYFNKQVLYTPLQEE